MRDLSLGVAIPPLPDAAYRELWSKRVHAAWTDDATGWIPLHPVASPYPNLGDAATDERIDDALKDSELRRALASIGIVCLGDLGLLMLAEEAEVETPQQGLASRAWHDAVSFALFGSSPERYSASLRDDGECLTLSIDIAAASGRLRAETAVSMPGVISPKSRGEVGAHFYRAAPTVVGRQARISRAVADSDPNGGSGPASELPALLDEFERVVVAALKDPAATIFAKRLGLHTDSVPTLDELARPLGLTRERVRQLERKIDQPRYARVVVPPLRAVAYELRRLTAPFVAVAPSMLELVLRTFGGLTEAAARRVETHLHRWDEQIVPPDFKRFDGPHGRAKSSGVTADAYADNLALLLARHGGSIEISQLRDLVRNEDWAEGVPSTLLSRAPDVLMLLGKAEVRDGHVQLTASLGRHTPERRLELYRSILERAGRPLHLDEIAAEFSSLPGIESAVRAQAVSGFLERYPDTFVWCGNSRYGLREWGVGTSETRERLTELGLAPSRRGGIGDEVAVLLHQTGHPLPLVDIENHILERFEVRAASVFASLTMDKTRRFVQLGNDWGLRRWAEAGSNGVASGSVGTAPAVQPAAGLKRVRLDADEIDRVVQVAVEATKTIDDKLRTGMAGVSDDQAMQWAVLKAAMGETESVVKLLAGRESLPKSAVSSVLSVGVASR